MLRFRYFPFFKHWAWHLIETRGTVETVLCASKTKHVTMQNAVRECERINGKNDYPIELLVNSGTNVKR